MRTSVDAVGRRVVRPASLDTIGRDMHAVTGFPAVTPEQFATRRQAGSTRTKRSHVYPRSPCNRADILSTSRHMPVLVGVVD